MGEFIVFFGASGSGKTALAQYLMDNGAEKIVSTTNRNPRVGEIQHKHYHFEDLKRIKEMIANDEFLEYAIYSGNYYGITKNEIKEKMENFDVVVHVMEINGALTVKKLYPNAVLIYCDAPIDVLMKRMYDRGDKFEDIAKRVKHYVEEKENENIKYADYVIDNSGSFEYACEQLDEIMKKL